METILKKTPNEEVYYSFEDQVELDLENIIICGNRDFCSYGDEYLIDIINNDYYDETLDDDGNTIGYDYDTEEMLNRYTGKKWKVRTMKGYSQGDWQEIYYTEEVSDSYLEEIENFYFGKVDEFTVVEDIGDDEDHYLVYVPHDVVWKGKKSICEYLGLDETTTKVFEDDGYVKVYNYKEIE